MVAKAGDEWLPITKHKSKQPRLYLKHSHAKAAATLIGSFSPFPLDVQGITTAGEWESV